MKNTNCEMPLIIASIGLAIFLVFWGVSLLPSDQNDKKIIKRIEKLEQSIESLQNAQT